MAKAGYHPAAAKELWVRMEAEARIKQIEGWLPEALTYYRPR